MFWTQYQPRGFQAVCVAKVKCWGMCLGTLYDCTTVNRMFNSATLIDKILVLCPQNARAKTCLGSGSQGQAFIVCDKFISLILYLNAFHVGCVDSS
jgi:hypothetical protein